MADINSSMVGAYLFFAGSSLTYGGAATAPVTGPAALVPVAGGLAISAEGGYMIYNSFSNLSKSNNYEKKEKSSPNPNGAKGKPDHQQKVNELAKKAEAENPGKEILQERKIKAEGSNRKPDVQVVDPNTKKTTKVYEAERKPNSSRNKKREAEYNRLGIPYETHKVGGN